MISFTYLSVFLFCLAYSAGEQAKEKGTTAPLEDVAHRELTDAGYVIRYGDASFRYPLRIVPLIRRVETEETNPAETNEIESGDEDKRRPLFYFTTFEGPEDPAQRGLPTSRPYIEIRKKRNVDLSEVPESSKVGKLRKKRTYCHKCGGGGGGGGYYVPVTFVVYPAYYGGGGKGKGCHTCGYGGYGRGRGGGGGGSFSYSSSSAHSSSGSWGWGKK